MQLFDIFKKQIPSNEQLCISAAELILRGKSKQNIKENFSLFIDEMNAQVYQQYLTAQKEIGQKILEARISQSAESLYRDLDSFYMSVFQSRKSRAGGAFEYVIRVLFTSLDYPFSEQVEIDGAKPDFVMPSKDFFVQRPLDCIIFTAKRTLRERWRQVVTEANKSYGFFLATIEKKVARNQIEQMAKHKVYLVVPKDLKENNEVYAAAYNVLSFEDFFSNHLDPALARWDLKPASLVAEQKTFFK